MSMEHEVETGFEREGRGLSSVEGVVWAWCLFFLSRVVCYSATVRTASVLFLNLGL